jgi:hypothetical protein
MSDDSPAMATLLAAIPKSHHASIRHAYYLGMTAGQSSVASEVRQALRTLNRVADLDVENEATE